jgi:hypothetical protein
MTKTMISAGWNPALRKISLGAALGNLNCWGITIPDLSVGATRMPPYRALNLKR